jgi:serine/threonine protein kinase
VLVAQNKGYLTDFGKVCEISRPKVKKYKEVYKHIAPEVLKGYPVTTASDMYSLGRVLKAISKKISSTILLQLANAATDLNPTKRPTLLKILTMLNAENQTGKFVLRPEISGAQFRTKCASGRANFENVLKKRALSKSTAFIRASEKLLRNISSSSAHLESEESVSARAALKKNASVRKCALGSEKSKRE